MKIFFFRDGALQHPPYPAGNKKDAGVLHCLSTVACVELELRLNTFVVSLTKRLYAHFPQKKERL
jgi:hypothetical protein